MAVKPRADDDQLRPQFVRKVFQHCTETGKIFCSRRAKFHWQVLRRPQAGASTGFIAITGSRIEWPAMDRKKPDPAVSPKSVLRSVAVMHIPIDNQDAIQSVFLRRDTRPMATLLNRQKPIASASNA